MPDHSISLDTLAIEREVLHRVDREVRDEFATNLVTHALGKRGLIMPPPGSAAHTLLMSAVAGGEIPLASGRTADAIVRELDRIRTRGLYMSRVEMYARKEEIDPRRLTPRIKEAMVDYLREIGALLDDDTVFANGGYDEYLALAYANALKVIDGSGDPIVAARLKAMAAPWDFSVRFYGDADQGGVVANFIRAVGAVDYALTLGDRLGVFRLAERAVELWEHGVIDVEDDQTASILFNYRENASQRGTPERRALLYRRVLGFGNARVMAGAVINEQYPHLWHRLMTEVARYIERREHQQHGARVSRAAIGHAMRNLQYNLSEFGAGGTAKSAHVLNAQLDDAMAILSAPEVVEQLAFGRRKSVWRVIDRLTRETTGRDVNVPAFRTLAEEGFRIHSYIAAYDETTPEQDHEDFIDACEQWILAEAAISGAGLPTPLDGDVQEEDEHEMAGVGGDDDDADWD